MSIAAHRTEILGLAEASRHLGVQVPAVVWHESSTQVTDTGPQVGQESPAWVIHGLYEINLVRDPWAYSPKPEECSVDDLRRFQRHTAWHELGHLFADLVIARGTNTGPIMRQVLRIQERTGVAAGEVFAEGVAQWLIERFNEPGTRRYGLRLRTDRLLMAEIGSLAWFMKYGTRALPRP